MKQTISNLITPIFLTVWVVLLYLCYLLPDWVKIVVGAGAGFLFFFISTLFATLRIMEPVKRWSDG